MRQERRAHTGPCADGASEPAPCHERARHKARAWFVSSVHVRTVHGMPLTAACAHGASQARAVPRAARASEHMRLLVQDRQVGRSERQRSQSDQPYTAEENRDPHRRQACALPTSHCRVSDKRIEGWIMSISFRELHTSPEDIRARRYALIWVADGSTTKTR